MTRPYTYILLSFAIGLLCVLYIRSKDRFEKEPFALLLVVCIWGGIWSYVVSGLLYDFLARWGLYDLTNTLGALLVIGPVEEISKLTALCSAYLIIRKQLNEPVDGLLYMACVALGFSLIENYHYAMAVNQGATRLFLARLLICTPAHINFSAFMGLAFYLFVRNKRTFPLLILAFCYASLVHGIYDLIIFNGYLIIILALVIWLAYKAAAALLAYAIAKSHFRCSLWSYFTPTDAQAPAPAVQLGFTCPGCGNTSAKPTYHLFSRKIQKCQGCGDHITTRAGLGTILRHFAAAPAKSFTGRPLLLDKATTNRGCDMVDDKNREKCCDKRRSLFHKSTDGKVVGFCLSALNRLIEIDNERVIQRMESRWWFPKQVQSVKNQADPVRSKE